MNIIVVMGPTATGKTDLGLELARKFNGELISADSRQVYKGLDIGAGKYPGNFKNIEKQMGCWVVDEIPIYLYDQVGLDQVYTAADFVNDARKIILSIQKKGKLPIVVGGTNFYINALLTPIPNLNLPINKVLREELSKYSLPKLQQTLQRLNMHKWEAMNHSDRQNPRRLTRAIEVAMSAPAEKHDFKKFNVLKIGLNAPREVLYERVDNRVVSRIDQGMVEEAKNLLKSGVSIERLKELGLEYGVLADNLLGEITDIEKVTQGKIHEYVRKQLTWLKKEKDINWFDITQPSYAQEVEKVVAGWYHLPDDQKN